MGPTPEQDAKAKQGTASPTPNTDSNSDQDTDDSASLEEFVQSDAFRNAHHEPDPAANPAAPSDGGDGPAPGDEAGAGSGDLTGEDVGQLFADAAAGDKAAGAIATILTDDAGLMGIQRQAQLGIANPDDVNVVLAERIEQAQRDADAAAGGDRDAWIRSQQNLLGRGGTPTPEQLAEFDKKGGPDILALEKQYQMLGLDTRPQGYLDRIDTLSADLEAARGGDEAAMGRLLNAFGQDPSTADPASLLRGGGFDQIASMLGSISSMPAGAGAGVPGLGTTPGSGGTATTSGATPSGSGPSSAPIGGGGFTGRLDAGDPSLGGSPGSGGQPAGGAGGSAGADGPGGGSDGGAGSMGDSVDPDPGPSDAGGDDGGSDPMGDNVDPDPGPSDAGGDDGGDPMGDHVDPDPGAVDPGGSDEPATPQGDVEIGEPELNYGTLYTRGENSDTYEWPSGERMEVPHGGFGGGGGGGGGGSGSGSGGTGSGSGTGGTGAGSGTGSGDGSDDESGRVDNDAGGYSNLTVSASQAQANLDQRLVREGGDPVDPLSDTQVDAAMVETPTTATEDYVTGEVIDTGGAVTRFPAPSDPPDPFAESMLLGGGAPDETIYESGTAGDASALQQDLSAPLHQAGAELGGTAPTLDIGGGDPNAGGEGGEFGPPGEG